MMELPGTGEVVKFHLIFMYLKMNWQKKKKERKKDVINLSCQLVFDFLLQLHRIVIQKKKVKE